MAKTTTAPATKTTTPANGKAETKKGLRKPQIRVLEALAKAKKPMARKEIAEKAPCDLAFLTEYLGSNNPEIREKNDAKFGVSLSTLKFVKVSIDEEQGTLYEITAAGRKALTSLTK